MMLEAKQHRHKTLSTYYTHLSKLHDYLVSIPSSSSLGSGILLEDDPEDYRKLLSTTLCACDEYECSSLVVSHGSLTNLDVHITQQEAIDRVLVELTRKRYNSAGDVRDNKNVLLTGDKFAIDLPINIVRPGVDNRHVNSPSSILRSTPWRILRSRIGDVIFRHLLLHTSLFLPVGNNCYIQFSGQPIYDKYQGANGETSKRSRDLKPQDKGRRRKRRRTKSSSSSTSPSLEVTIETEFKSLTKRPNSRIEGPADTYIARQKMFYGRPSRRPNGTILYGLPPSHMLNKLASPTGTLPSDKNCISLLRSIFPKVLIESNQYLPKIKGSVKRVSNTIGIMRELLVKHSSINYASEIRKCRRRVEDGLIGDNLTSVSHSQVCRLMTSILKQLLSPISMGSTHNIEVFIRHIRRLVQAKQYEPISLHLIMQDLRINDIEWLQTSDGSRVSPQEHEKRKRLLGDLVFWLVDDHVIPLIKNTFYVTETAATRYETVYYFHDDWSAASKPHFEQLKDDLLDELDKDQSYFALQGQLGVSAVRLIPKPNGFRPIVNLGKRIKAKVIPGISITGSTKTLSANQILRPVHQVLTFEKDRHKTSLGSSLFGTNEVFGPIQSLKIELLSKYGKIPRLYFVKMDIKAAFDTIKQDKMLDTVNNLLDKNHDYCLMLYSLLLPPASKAAHGSARRLFKSRAILNDGLGSAFGDHAEQIAKPLRNAVLVDLVRRRNVSREACMQLLKQHITENVWQIGSKLFRQKTGIPQGSKISSLLCSIFYACLEIEYLAFTQRRGSRLLRYIDDFLFITDDYRTARRFVTTMENGFPEYGAFVSPTKTFLSFEYATGSQVAPVCDLDASMFPYCGFLIDMRNLDMSMDYARLISGPIQQSFAVRSTRKRGKNFVGWLSRQLENRNHVAYLDTRHNSFDTVYLNVYLNFALTAMKIPHYFTQKEIPANQAILVFHSLCLSVEYTYIAGKARVRHASRDDIENDHFRIRQIDFTFLALSAIFKILSRKASKFKEILTLLGERLAKREFRGMDEKHKGVVERACQAVKDAMY